MIMKKIIYSLLLAASVAGVTGCKKFLNVDPPSDLSGNNFWQTVQDVEKFTNGNYELFREAVTRLNMQAGAGDNEYPYLPFAGELRGGMVKENTELGWGRGYIADLATNNIRRFVDFQYSGNNWNEIFNHKRFTQWDRYYRVIAAANIAVDRINGVPDPNMTDQLKAQYTGEAVFIRCLAYFFMVRQFGDVAYYTEPYFSDPLKRMPMVEVLKNCITDMKSAYKGMPWSYSDPFYVGIRGMRGGAIALMMEINLWLAGFDQPNAAAYYNEVVALANEIRNENGGAYELLPINRYIEIFKGRSKENLFGVPQNRNYGESFGWSDFFDQVKYDPLRPTSASIPYMSYTADFMRALYPEGVNDQRLSLWFNPATAYAANRSFQMKKFLVTADPNSIDFNNRNDATQCIYRYADVFLMQAEAYSGLGDEASAKEIVNNIIRKRAVADPISESGDDFKDQLFLERARELIGEGHYWFDLVRTRRITDPRFKYSYHCSVEQFKRGAWTWPIDRAALVQNPQMTLNMYWEQ